MKRLCSRYDAFREYHVPGSIEPLETLLTRRLNRRDIFMDPEVFALKANAAKATVREDFELARELPF